MKARISKIGNITTNKNHITILALCPGQALRMDDINVDIKGILFLGDDKISCALQTISKKKRAHTD